jgi:hypothetical protein
VGVPPDRRPALALAANVPCWPPASALPAPGRRCQPDEGAGEPRLLFAAAEAAGDRLAVLPVLYHRCDARCSSLTWTRSRWRRTPWSAGPGTGDGAEPGWRGICSTCWRSSVMSSSTACLRARAACGQWRGSSNQGNATCAGPQKPRPAWSARLRRTRSGGPARALARPVGRAVSVGLAGRL